MRLFTYEGFKVTIAPEALTLKSFKKIWDRDRSSSKSKAITELSYIYFYCDPRSEYAIFIDEETRAAEIKKGEGLPDKWEPDKLVIEAMELYRKLTVTVSAGLLEDARVSIDRIRTQLRQMSFADIESAKLPKALRDATDTLTRIPDLIEAFQKAERALNSEILENSKMRGQGNKTIFEDGFDGGTLN